MVTIHISYIDENQFDEMKVRHYSSFSDDTPTDPAGKFVDALGKLMRDYTSQNPGFFSSSAMREFELLYEKRYFPGLGHVKKLSIEHHVETICHYLASQSS